MDQQTFRQAILLLSGEHSVTILRALRDGDWHLSSEVARVLDIHITTASKFLQRFSDLGLVDCRPHVRISTAVPPPSIRGESRGRGRTPSGSDRLLRRLLPFPV